MDVLKDFAELCSLLNEQSVEFLIVGGYAVGYHGAPRFTGDLDILVHPDVRQVGKMLEALTRFGFPAEDLAPEYVLEQKKIMQLGRQPVQVHLMTNITGVDWDEAWASKRLGMYGDVPVFFIGRQALIDNKRATGRTKDLADVEALERPELD
jgi:hypothetical protein